MAATPSGGADLHLHTTCSDGLLSPEVMAARAVEESFAAIALTDHDTTEGILRAREAANGALEVVAGVEFGTPNSDPALPEMHLVGLFLDPEHDELRTLLERWRRDRGERAVRMVEKLNRAGMAVTTDEVLAQAGEGIISRVHVARVLAAKGYVPTVGAAFRRWIGRDGPAFVPRERLPVAELIALIHRAGGAAVLAHPALNVQDDAIRSFAEAGLDGIEVYCPDHSAFDATHYEAVARYHDLLASGGSDYHGYVRANAAFGSVRVEMACVEALRTRALEHKERRRHV